MCTRLLREVAPTETLTVESVLDFLHTRSENCAGQIDYTQRFA
jgi:hypothetical protein